MNLFRLAIIYVMIIPFLSGMVFSDSLETDSRYDEDQRSSDLRPMRNSRMIGAKRSNKIYIGSSQKNDVEQDSSPKRLRSSRMMGAKRAGYVVVESDSELKVLNSQTPRKLRNSRMMGSKRTGYGVGGDDSEGQESRRLKNSRMMGGNRVYQSQTSSGRRFKASSVPNVSIDHGFNSQKEYNAIYDYITTQYKAVKKDDARKIAKYLVEYGRKNNVDPKLAAAVIARESSFNKRAVSRTGAKGLGQIKDFNFKSLNIRDPFDIRQNVSGTVSYLKHLVGRWKGDSRTTSLTLASYFEGPNAIKSKNGRLEGHTKYYVRDILNKYSEIKGYREKYR